MSSSQPQKLSEVKRLYEQGENVMQWFREKAGAEANSLESILISYDLQSGSYVKALKDPQHQAKLDEYTAAIARALQPLGAQTLLEAGVGEATTLRGVLEKLQPSPERVFGFDIAWSRIAVAMAYAAQAAQRQPLLCTGNFFSMPFADDAFDVVFTSHAIEPNHGREEEAMRELYRVTRRWLVLFEPAYELGNDATRRHVEKHGFCRGLAETAVRLGFRVMEHRLLDVAWVDYNQTGVVIIEKDHPKEVPAACANFACPRCRQILLEIRRNLFCADCLVVYPVIDGIPCLLTGNAILATQYPDIRTG